MEISSAINQVHLLSQGNTDYPSSGEDDFALYLGFINNAIGIWQHQEGIAWNELSSTATGTLASGDATYNLPADFALPAGQVFISSTHYQYSTVAENAVTSEVDGAFKRYTITGPNGAKVLTLYPTPGSAEDGLPYTLPYYKEATTFTTGAETTPLEMSDPYYAVHYAVGMVMLEDNPTVASTHIGLANQKLMSMRIHNDVKPAGTFEIHQDLGGGFGN